MRHPTPEFVPKLPSHTVVLPPAPPSNGFSEAPRLATGRVQPSLLRSSIPPLPAGVIQPPTVPWGCQGGRVHVSLSDRSRLQEEKAFLSGSGGEGAEPGKLSRECTGTAWAPGVARLPVGTPAGWASVPRPGGCAPPLLSPPSRVAFASPAPDLPGSLTLAQAAPLPICPLSFCTGPSFCPARLCPPARHCPVGSRAPAGLFLRTV